MIQLIKTLLLDVSKGCYYKSLWEMNGRVKTLILKAAADLCLCGLNTLEFVSQIIIGVYEDKPLSL